MASANVSAPRTPYRRTITTQSNFRWHAESCQNLRSPELERATGNMGERRSWPSVEAMGPKSTVSANAIRPGFSLSLERQDRPGMVRNSNQACSLHVRQAISVGTADVQLYGQ